MSAAFGGVGRSDFEQDDSENAPLNASAAGNSAAPTRQLVFNPARGWFSFAVTPHKSQMPAFEVWANFIAHFAPRPGAEAVAREPIKYFSSFEFPAVNRRMRGPLTSSAAQKSHLH
ncbi:hypothetical protein G3A43_07135 [Paraburkholderia aspalathi]|nr:hypothetical protein [Paraburkholderia aspalathi]MBK3780026.1 hypothetical protein [Paraburkholderia aspalathi]